MGLTFNHMLDRLRGKTTSQLGVDVAGYFSSHSGVGQAGRLVVEALRSVDYPVNALNVRREFGAHDDARSDLQTLLYRRLLMSIDAHSFRETYAEISKLSRKKKYVIAQWFWELEAVPPYFHEAMQLIDELWVPSQYMRDAFLAVAPHDVDVRLMHLPLDISLPQTRFSREHFSLDSRFTFLFIFDFLSVMKRKNPIGVVNAFRQAFTDGEGPMLVIKTANSDLRPSEFEALMATISDRSDIRLINQPMSTTELISLVSVCDAYVSLHRAEGLGLTLAEAMSLGKPVIATEYSGNLEFMNSENSILIPWRRVKVGNNAEGYDSEATWAEPNIEMCASEMRRLVFAPNLCRSIGDKARDSISLNFSHNVTGLKMVERLERV